MGDWGETHASFLKELFGDRVSFDRAERKLYGHDIAEMPSLVGLVMGETVPDAVAQPASEEELVKLVHWAAENRVPLTPRGRATSGYGGVLPLRGGGGRFHPAGPRPGYRPGGTHRQGGARDQL